MPPRIPSLSLLIALAATCASLGLAGGEGRSVSAAEPPDVRIAADSSSGSHLFLETFAGVQTFRGTPDAGSGGGFGVYEGFLLGAPMADSVGGLVVFEGGVAFAHSNLGGSVLTPEGRQQIFATVGAGRSVDLGLGAAIVCDYLHDDWYAASSASQLRGETAWAFGGGREIGLWGSIGVSEDSSAELVTLYGMSFPAHVRTRPIDLYGAFYRSSLVAGGEARLFAGLTDSAQAVAGVDLRLPLSNRLSVDSGFTYLSPERDDRSIGAMDFSNLPAESWSFRVGLELAFGADPGAAVRSARPLLPVASNSSFFLGRSFGN